MKYTKEEIEESLAENLDLLLSYGNQEGSIIDLVYNEEKKQCVVTMTVVIVEQDDYIGFQGY